MMKKHENSKVAGLRARTDTEQMVTFEIMSFVRSNICAKKGDLVNVGSDFAKAQVPPVSACVIGKREWGESLYKLPTVVGLSRWLGRQRDAKALHSYCALAKTQHLQPIWAAIEELTGMNSDTLAPRLESATHEAWLRTIFVPTLMVMEAGYSTTSLPPFGSSQCVLVLDGTLTVLGVESGSLPGLSYSSKLAAMGNMSEESLNLCIQKNTAFVAKLGTGRLAFFPHTHILRVDADAASVVLKWSTLHAEDASVLRDALSNCMTIAASFPSLAVGPFQNFVALLQERIASAEITS